MDNTLFNNPYQNVYGITGILGSGKTTCSNILQKLGCIVFFADEITHFILSPAYKQYDDILYQLESSFQEIALKQTNQSIVNQDKTVNRTLLGNLAFKNEKNINILNQIMHPHIQAEFEKQLSIAIKQKKIKNKPIIYDIPLLFENNFQKYFKKTILVYTSEKIAMQRFSNRTGLSIEEAQERLKHQISIDKKRELADYSIDNQKDIINLENKTRIFYENILK